MTDWIGIAAVITSTFAGVVSLITVLRVSTVRTEVAEVKTNVITIEKATNSMKDALVKSSGDAKLAEGREIGRSEAAAKAATLAEGRLSAQENPTP